MQSKKFASSEKYVAYILFQDMVRIYTSQCIMVRNPYVPNYCPDSLKVDLRG